LKCVILAGGVGSLISEESHLKPKPMIEIGGKPILWHIMKIYSSFGINDFIICLGYKGYLIKEYFANYYLHTSDMTFDMVHNKMKVHQNSTEPWRVTLVDTGEHTQTGGRLKRVRSYLGDKDFCFTYGDGVGNVDIQKLMTYHRKQKTWATLTAAEPPGRFGAFTIRNGMVTSFREKPRGDGGWVNAGFFVLSPKAVDFIDGDQTSWESRPLETLAEKGQLAVYQHRGFWHPMDTLRDRTLLEDHWNSGRPPWKVWK
jgi:glucose-1-phosphate cytidylyltransferase